MKSTDIVLNRSLVIEYALKYATNPNTPPTGSFQEFDSDCTNFISQCWSYGGIPQDPVGWYWNNRFDYSKSWTVVDDFANYMTYASAFSMDDGKPIAVYKWSSNEVKAGDIIQFYNPSSGWHHSAVITKIINGEIHYAHHTENSSDRKLSDVYPHKETQVRFICPAND